MEILFASGKVGFLPRAVAAIFELPAELAQQAQQAQHAQHPSIPAPEWLTFEKWTAFSAALFEEYGRGYLRPEHARIVSWLRMARLPEPPTILKKYFARHDGSAEECRPTILEVAAAVGAEELSFMGLTADGDDQRAFYACARAAAAIISGCDDATRASAVTFARRMLAIHAEILSANTPRVWRFASIRAIFDPAYLAAVKGRMLRWNAYEELISKIRALGFHGEYVKEVTTNKIPMPFATNAIVDEMMAMDLTDAERECFLRNVYGSMTRATVSPIVVRSDLETKVAARVLAETTNLAIIAMNADFRKICQEAVKIDIADAAAGKRSNIRRLFLYIAAEIVPTDARVDKFAEDRRYFARHAAAKTDKFRVFFQIARRNRCRRGRRRGCVRRCTCTRKVKLSVQVSPDYFRKLMTAVGGYRALIRYVTKAATTKSNKKLALLNDATIAEKVKAGKAQVCRYCCRGEILAAVRAGANWNARALGALGKTLMGL